MNCDSDKLRASKPDIFRMPLKKEEILTQNHRPRPARLRLTRPIALTILPFFGVVAAFGISTDTTPGQMDIQHVVEDIALPTPVSPVEAETQRYWREERIQRGDTIVSILRRLGVNDPDAMSYLLQSRGVRTLKRLVPGRAVRSVTTSSGHLEKLSYLDANGKRLLVERVPEGFHATEEFPELEPRIAQSSGEIRSSLFEATDAVGLHESVAVQLADIFSSDIDFNRDLRGGDRFAVVYEANYADGEFSGVGRVIAATFTNQARTYRAVYFEDKNGRGGYYGPDGKNVRKAFLRSPLAFSRISSRYTNARFHPVLRKWRAHRGIDYAARIGTPVRATADGTVVGAGRKGSYGILISLRHPNGYATRYAHLSRIASGIHRGARVYQGQVIGFVGKTGLASGPHLHYEFLANGRQRNPLKHALPPGPSITANLRDAFDASAAPLLKRLDLLDRTNLASLD